MNKICVIGLGYIGLPTALLLAKNGHTVFGVDINKDVIETLNNGNVHISEPGLEQLFQESKHNFSVGAEPVESDIFIIAVPTPLDSNLRISNLQYVRSATESILSKLKKENVVIVESTIPPGTSEKIVIPILERSGLKRGDFGLCHCPERAIPGNTLYEMQHNDRIVGGLDEMSISVAEGMYSSFVKGSIYKTSIKIAEFVKLIENTSRDVNIALANELAKLADDYSIDVWEAIELANKHPRVNILKPGPGVGGHCIAVDPWFLTESSMHPGIIQMAREINDSMPNHVMKIVRNTISGIRNPKITLLGLSYKADIADRRESPAFKILQLANNEGFITKKYDPYVKGQDCGIDFISSCDGSDLLLLITDHEEFIRFDPSKIDNMNSKNIIDTRNCINRAKWESAGFNVKILGDGKML